MPFLQSSGPISLNDIRSMFGGPASPSLSDYYRGGSFIPATKPVTVFDPPGGGFIYSGFPYDSNPPTQWAENMGGDSKTGYYYSSTSLFWGGTNVANFANASATSFTVGGFTYFKDSGSMWGPFRWRIRRTSTTNQAINTGIPSSGAISLSQFYGAEQP